MYYCSSLLFCFILAVFVFVKMCFHPNLRFACKTLQTIPQKVIRDDKISARYSSEHDNCEYVQPEEIIGVEESDFIIMQLNIRGYQSKINQFKSLIENLTDSKKPDVILLSETWSNKMQGLSVPFACVGSGDPVRVLCLYTMNTLDILWSIYCWDICTTCRYRC